jgi:hypothetical protein
MARRFLSAEASALPPDGIIPRRKGLDWGMLQKLQPIIFEELPHASVVCQVLLSRIC